MKFHFDGRTFDIEKKTVSVYEGSHHNNDYYKEVKFKTDLEFFENLIEAAKDVAKKDIQREIRKSLGMNK